MKMLINAGSGGERIIRLDPPPRSAEQAERKIERSGSQAVVEDLCDDIEVWAHHAFAANGFADLL